MKPSAATRKPEVFGGIDAAATQKLVEAASDVALVLDAQGRVLHAALLDPAMAAGAAASWVGRAWSDIVTDDSRDKVAMLLAEALAGAPLRWRQVNHPGPDGEDWPVQYGALRLPDAAGRQPRVVAFGRDLRGTVVLQHRLVEAQQAMERDYWRFREAETRFRNLFQTSPEAVLVADGQSLKILEVNAAAEALAGRAGLRLAGAPLHTLFEGRSGEALQSLLALSRSGGRRDPMRLALAPSRQPVDVTVSVFQQEQAPFLLVRLLPVAGAATGEAAGTAAGARGEPMPALALLEAYARQSPDGLVFTDAQGRILLANRAFALLAQLSGEEGARGELLDRWVGRTGVELGVLISNLRQRGSAGLFTTSLRGEYGALLEVEISASLLGTADAPTMAFAVRDIGRRLQAGVAEERAPDRLTRSAGELTELVGRVPMKDIVSETTDVIEQLCIETALQMTQDNRALAAQLLGLSRQSLYVKLRRFGIGDATAEPAPGSSD